MDRSDLKVYGYREARASAGGDGPTASFLCPGSEREMSCLEIQTTNDKFPHGDQGLVDPFRYDFGGIRHVKNLRTIRELERLSGSLPEG